MLKLFFCLRDHLSESVNIIPAKLGAGSHGDMVAGFMWIPVGGAYEPTPARARQPRLRGLRRAAVARGEGGLCDSTAQQDEFF